ncbi:hypothetical protein HU735_10020 [Pseudomonas sp. BW16M2]|uniref:hypothetical protein n=1 Tax=Pseudomonas sp. BW16M2 TaxID=2745489 RepID=UPI001646B9B5|nr:hypothetical protein [Pseudomonas sp. BW16M2]MBC3435751.1 hypothetical protein [Pseudomonas sp. BW16M2]
MEFVVPRSRHLPDLLANASSADLNVLADLITDNGNGRVALDSKVKTTILARQAKGTLQSIPDVLDAEIRAFGSNSIATLFRSEGVSYLELATDAAKKLDGKLSESLDIFEIEKVVVCQAVEKYAGVKGIGDYATALGYVAQVVKGLISVAGTASGIAATGGAAGIAGAIGGRLLSMAVPPLAVAAAGATIFQAASPAFRITVPAVLQIAKIRQARYEYDFAIYTEKLRACM